MKTGLTRYACRDCGAHTFRPRCGTCLSDSVEPVPEVTAQIAGIAPSTELAGAFGSRQGAGSSANA